MCIEYNECHYGGMYNVYLKKEIFVITKIVHMNVCVSYEKEKVKESQSQSRSVAPSLDTHFRCRVGGVTSKLEENKIENIFQQFEKLSLGEKLKTSVEFKINPFEPRNLKIKPWKL